MQSLQTASFNWLTSTTFYQEAIVCNLRVSNSLQQFESGKIFDKFSVLDDVPIWYQNRQLILSLSDAFISIMVVMVHIRQVYYSIERFESQQLLPVY